MTLPRPFASLQTEDQWLRAAHQGTAIEAGVVQLAFSSDAAAAAEGSSPELAAALAFDPQCRLYHSLPDEGRVERELWAAADPAPPSDLFAPSPSDLPAGGFHPSGASRPPLGEPRGLAVDADGRLYVAETGARRLLIFDLWSPRLLRRVPLTGRPLDLCLSGDSVLCVTSDPAALIVLEAHTGPRPLPLPGGATEPARVAILPDGTVCVLDSARTAGARVISAKHTIAVPWATDIEFQPGPVLVIARGTQDDFLRFGIGDNSVEELAPLKARGYDGLGIVLTPDDRIGFWTAKGFRHAVPARVRYQPSGRIVTYRLDSGEYRMVWGRLFLDACIPRDTNINVACLTADEPPADAPEVPRTLPANVTDAVIGRPDLSPPMPAAVLVPATVTGELHRRETGRELPFAPFAADDPFETYETPILAGPGRYLWVFLELSGNTRFTPRLRSLRAEYPSHDYMRRLPRVYSREEQSASFLRRYLALMDGFLGELDARATARQALLGPASAPSESLAWLAGFLGLTLDERWPVAVQRAVLAETAWLFRFRGTVRGLARFLDLYTGVSVIIVEKFRLRGLGALGEAGGPESRSILGAGFRVGGALGDANVSPLVGTEQDAFDTHAHRFSVIIPARLSVEQTDVVRRILDVHRPAHTLFDLCTVDAGLRVGRGLHVGLTPVIGRSGGFTTLQTGGSRLGTSAVVGRAVAGTRLESSVLGTDSRVG